MSRWLRRYERRSAKRYAHMVRGDRPCWRLVGGFCARCAWRKVSGRMARDHAAHLARLDALEAKADACSHENREPGRQPMFEWHCADCHTSKWVPKEARP